jgi:hypothetical protein
LSLKNGFATALDDVRFGSCVDGAHGSRGSFGFLLAVGCKSCVRPVCAAS